MFRFLLVVISCLILVACENTAKITVESVPEAAQVLIDGRDVGKAPVFVDVSPGKHAVSVRLDGYENWEQTIDANRGRTSAVTAELEPQSRYKQLTRERDDRAPVWIDNDTIRFYRLVTVQDSIAELSLSTNELRLRPLSTKGWRTAFYWSPTRRYLLFVNRGGHAGMWLYDSVGDKLEELSFEGVSSDDFWDVQWAADESYLVALLAGEVTNSEDRGYDPTFLAKIDLRSRTLAKIADLPKLLRNISLAPDGGRVIISVYLDPNARDSHPLQSIRLSDPRLQELPVRGSFRIQWSPDGRGIAFFARNSPPGNLGNRDGAVWVAMADGSQARRLAASRDADKSFLWLPDGTRFLLGDMTLVDVTSGAVSPIPLPKGVNLRDFRAFGALSPDGKKVLLETDQGLAMVNISD